MITIRRAFERGYFKNDWLSSYHTFSFGEYYDPKYVHFNNLRVINEDFIAQGQGFNSHSHQNMEIMTYVISGELAHKDSMGNTLVIKSGEVQFMRAGINITHSEFNPSQNTATHLLQIWVIPKEKNLKPTYVQNFYSLNNKKDKLCMLANGKNTANIFQIAQDVIIYASILNKESAKISYSIDIKDEAWIQIVSGELLVNNTLLEAGDGAGIQNETELDFSSNSSAEFLLFHFYK